MSLIYFKLNRDDIKVQLDVKTNESLTLNIIKPKWDSIHNILWDIISFGRFREYQLINEDNIVLSYSQVMPKIYKFAFMDDCRGIHIGPCFTYEEYRGQGLYPYLLQKVILGLKGKQNFYIFCDERNIASKKGIEKAGFKAFAIGRKTKLGIYVIEKYL